jgi:hypothetical protein
MSSAGVCSESTQSGAPCKARVVPGATTCRWHDPSPEARAKHQAESRRGGEAKAYGALVAGEPLSADATVCEADLTTAAGLAIYVAGALRALARLPFDVRVAHAISSLAGTQRNALQETVLEDRLAALESQRRGPPPYVSPFATRSPEISQ